MVAAAWKILCRGVHLGGASWEPEDRVRDLPIREHDSPREIRRPQLTRNQVCLALHWLQGGTEGIGVWNERPESHLSCATSWLGARW